MAEESGGMTVRKLIVLIIGILVLVLIVSGAYNGWLMNGLEKMGSQMDKVLIFFNQKQSIETENECTQAYPIIIEDQLNAYLTICPNECFLETVDKIKYSINFKKNETGSYKFLPKLEETSHTGDEGWSSEGDEWVNINKFRKTLESETIQASQDWNYLLNTLEKLTQEDEQEITKECNTQENCPYGYFCNTPLNSNTCKEYTSQEDFFYEENLNSQKVLILNRNLIPYGTGSTIYLNYRGDLYYFINEDYDNNQKLKIKIGESSVFGRLKIYHFDEIKDNIDKLKEEIPWFLWRDIKLNNLKSRVKNSINNRLYELNTCYYEKLNQQLLKLYLENNPHSLPYENPYINEKPPKYYCEKGETAPKLNRIFHSNEKYYIFIANSNYNKGNQKIGTLIYNQNDKWFQGEISGNKELEFDKLKEGWRIFSREITNFEDAVTQIRKISNNRYNVYHGPITSGMLKQTQYLNYNFGVVNKTNENDLYNVLITNLTENEVQTRETKQDFQEHLNKFNDENPENNLNYIEFGDDKRMILTLNNKIGITKNEERDVLEIDFPDLKLYENKNGEWSETDFVDINYFLEQEQIDEQVEDNEKIELITNYLNNRC